jgi:diguanylate cyclase (GGDEF)-like protein
MDGRDRRWMVRSAAAIYAGAALLTVLAAAPPGGQGGMALEPGAVAVVASLVLLAVGTRLPTREVFLFGLLGVALIGVAVATSDSYGDGAVLYMWPAVWTAYFFRTRGAILIVAWIGIVHAVALMTLPPDQGSVERWLDVEVAVAVVAAVVRTLAIRQARLVDRLAQEARVDPLTGLLNRRGFDERLGLELARAGRDQTWLTVVRFDVDHFKQINDTYGHDAGDRVLAWLGRAVTEHIRGVDAAARVGGDELIIVVPRTDAAAGRALADRIRAIVATARPEGIDVSVSAGVASVLAPQGSAQILQEADRALYQAKAAGRDQVAAADGANARPVTGARQ